MYYKCIKCDKFGEFCRGRNFALLSWRELQPWLLAYRKAHNFTYATLAAKTGVPQGTLARILADPDADPKHETVRAIMHALCGEHSDDDLCPDPTSSESDQLRAQLQHLEQELADTKQLASHAHESHTAAAVRQDAHARSLRRALAIASGLLIVVLFAIIGVLVYDLTHPSIGYFGR